MAVPSNGFRNISGKINRIQGVLKQSEGRSEPNRNEFVLIEADDQVSFADVYLDNPDWIAETFRKAEQQNS